MADVALTQLDGSPYDRKGRDPRHWDLGVFVDNDLSARGHKRPEYDRLMRYVKGGDIQVIICFAQDRLWRNMKQAADGIEELKDLNARLLFTKTGEELDLSQSDQKFKAGLMSLLASWFGDDISEKQRNATREAAQAGAYHGARPFGFTLAHLNDPANPAAGTHEPRKAEAGERVRCPGCGGRASNTARTILIRPDEAEAVRQAYELAAVGIPPYQICLYLDGHQVCEHLDGRYQVVRQDKVRVDWPEDIPVSRHAIATANGKRWERVGVQGLLGVLRARRNYGWREWSAKWDGGKRPPGTLIKGNWTGIIDEPLYDAVKRQLDGRAKMRPGGNDPAHLLTGYTFGGFCQHPLRIHKINGKRRYACGAWRSDGQCVSFEAEPAELEVERYLFKWLAGNTMLAKALEHTGNADLQKLYSRRKTLIEQREDLENKDSDHHWGEGPEADATFKRLRDRKNKQIDDVGDEIDALLDSGAATPRSGRKSFPTGGAFRAEWRDADLAGKRAIIRRFIDKVDIYPAGAGNKPDPRLIRIHPGSWAGKIESAQPLAAPDPASFTSKGQILVFLRDRKGEWFTRADIAMATGVSPTAAHKVLTALEAAGEITAEWRRRGGQRACYMYSGTPGSSWESRDAEASHGTAWNGIKTFLESDENCKRWFTAAEIREGSGAGGEPHVIKTLNLLIAAGFVQRRRAPRKDVRYQYSINGR